MSSVLHQWQTQGHRYRLCRDRAQMPGWQELAPFHALGVLRAQLADPQARQVLFTALLGASQWRLSPNWTDPGVLEREVELARIFVLDQAIAPLPVGRIPANQPPAPQPPGREPHREQSWIEITVVDDRVPARPLAGARFRLTLPDGSTREGLLNRQGNLRIDDIDPGKCWLELPDLGREINA